VGAIADREGLSKTLDEDQLKKEGKGSIASWFFGGHAYLF